MRVAEPQHWHDWIQNAYVVIRRWKAERTRLIELNVVETAELADAIAVALHDAFERGKDAGLRASYPRAAEPERT